MEVEERLIERWQGAGLLSAESAAAIRAWERAHHSPGTRQWQVLLALLLGAILLGAGVLLFVAAHWDAVSPGGRLLLVLAMLVLLHGAALLPGRRFPGLATALQAVGTVSAGAAIALVGQIFHLQEHWPSAVLLWGACAAAGWWLLRDQCQQTLTLLLMPAWVLCEWAERTDGYGGASVSLERMVLVLAAVYLTAWLRSRRRVVAGVLFAVGATAAVVAVALLADTGWRGIFVVDGGRFLPLGFRLAAYAMTVATVALGAWRERRTLAPAAMAFVLGMALPWAQTQTVHLIPGGSSWVQSEPSLIAFGLVGLCCIGLVASGVHSGAKALVNFGTVGFGLTVMWFYFSSVMDKLGRSLGLIALGALFLAGGWVLEQARRRLLRTMTSPEVAP